MNETTKKEDPFAWMEDFVLTDEEAAALPDWVIEDLITQGRVNVIAADPDIDRVTLFLHLATKMKEAGFEVMYLDEESTDDDAYKMRKVADDKGLRIRLLANKRRGSLARALEHLGEGGDDGVSNRIYIFSPLHKAIDNRNLRTLRSGLSAIRKVADSGATVIILGASKDDEGSPDYQNINCIASSIDYIIYLTQEKKPDGSVIITSEPDMGCDGFLPVKFEIDPEGIVKQLNGGVK